MRESLVQRGTVCIKILRATFKEAAGKFWVNVLQRI
jgi:hypothetical protein